MRPQLLAAMILMGVAVVSSSAAQTDEASARKVKATATATKPDAKGMQTVTVTLEIAKGCYVLANPANLEIFEATETTVKVTAKVKPTNVAIVYPRGKRIVDGKFKYDIYEGVVKIQANIQRAVGDGSPLEVTIDARPMARVLCYLPERIKLTIP